jgi:hypothetical protein
VSERSESTRKGILAEQLVRDAVSGHRGVCDCHTTRGGYELHWGPTSKNAVSLAHDLERSHRHGGCCVQLAGPVSRSHRRMGVISLYEFLRLHGVANPATVASEIRAEASNGTATDSLEETALMELEL